jgi:hypothetical protein
MLSLSKPPPGESLSPAVTVGSGWPPRSAELLANVDRLLRAGRPREAVDAIGDSYLPCPWTANALAVCHLRLGNSARAVRLLRYIAADHTSHELRADVPLVFKTNLATALLADGNVEGFLSTLDEIGEEDHPSVRRLRGVAAGWKDSLSAWQTFWWNTAGLVPRAPALGFPPGELRARPVGTHNSTVHPPDGLSPFVEGVGTMTDGPAAVGAALMPLPRAGAA